VERRLEGRERADQQVAAQMDTSRSAATNIINTSAAIRLTLLHRERWMKVSLIAALVLMMFVAALLEVSIWAATYLLVGAFSALEPALYFSTVTFATLGYGDITLNESWRLLASFEAANGIIMFGWTTALIFAVVQRLAAHDQARVAEPENGPSLTKR
jgi:hypothetical protein